MQTVQKDVDGKETTKTYGFGYESYEDPNFQHIRTHGGGGYGSNSRVMIDTKNNQSAVALVSFEDLTLPLAFALEYGNQEQFKNLKLNEIPQKSLKLDEKLYHKSQELKQNFNEEQLLEMRNQLEKAENIGEFLRKFNENSKPSSSPQQAHIRSENLTTGIS